MYFVFLIFAFSCQSGTDDPTELNFGLKPFSESFFFFKEKPGGGAGAVPGGGKIYGFGPGGTCREPSGFDYVASRLLYQPDEVFRALDTDLVVRFSRMFTSLNKGLVHVWYL